MRQEILSWTEVDRLIDALLPQFHGNFDAMLMITRGGLVPGGMLCEALDIKTVLIAAVDFPGETQAGAASKLMAWPNFLQFPDESLLRDRRVLVVDDVWGSGRTITAVKNRVEAAGGTPELCVLHYNPKRSLFTKSLPTYYAAFTDAYIVFPWEIDRGGPEGVPAGMPKTNLG
ncbi:MAG: phosphoribosyltransferase [Anaerolineales bacterium]